MYDKFRSFFCGENGHKTVFISKMDLIMLVRKHPHMGSLACHHSVKCRDTLPSLSSHSNSHGDQVLIDKIYNHPTQSSNDLQWLDQIIGYPLNRYPQGCHGDIYNWKIPLHVKYSRWQVGVSAVHSPASQMAIASPSNTKPPSQKNWTKAWWWNWLPARLPCSGMPGSSHAGAEVVENPVLTLDSKFHGTNMGHACGWSRLKRKRLYAMQF